MRKIKDVLRLKLDARMSQHQIAGALGISKGVVTKYVGLAAAAGIDWAAVQGMDEVTQGGLSSGAIFHCFSSDKRKGAVAPQSTNSDSDTK